MMFGLSTLMTRIAFGVIAIVLLMGFLQVRSCQQARQRAAESRLEREQGTAAVESGKDALATQGAAYERERAIDQQAQQSIEEIHDARGANSAVDPAVNNAGRRGLCAIAAFRNDPKCKLGVQQPDASGVGKAH